METVLDLATIPSDLLGQVVLPFPSTRPGSRTQNPRPPGAAATRHAAMSAAAALRATEPLPLPSGLSLSPRLKLLLTFFRADLTVRPLDEWQLKSALLAFLRDPPLSLPLLPDSDLSVRRLPDLQKRRREEPVASGVLHVRDLSFLRPRKGDSEAEGMTVEQEDEKYFEWRSSLVEKLEGIELNLEGVKFRMTVEIPPSDDFRVMKKSWENFYSSELLNSSMNWFLYCIFLILHARWSWD